MASGDPAPDLVVEVDRTSPSLNKLPIYARLGVPEVWRYVVGETGHSEILALRSQASEGYEPIPESRILPSLTGEALARLIEGGRTKEPAAWAREVRGWAREARSEPGV